VIVVDLIGEIRAYVLM